MPGARIVEAATRDHTPDARYAWIIDTDHLWESTDPAEDNEAGVTGPSNAPEELLARLKAGQGRAFRMFDGDGELNYSGRIIVREREGTAWTDAEGGEEDFGPLWDFGTPNAGATEIKYQRGAAWVAL